jgi:hypothetical protein
MRSKVALSENLGVIHQNCPGKEGKRDTPERERRERESRAKKSRAKKKHERERERNRSAKSNKERGSFFLFFRSLLSRVFSLSAFVFFLTLFFDFFFSPPESSALHQTFKHRSFRTLVFIITPFSL